ELGSFRLNYQVNTGNSTATVATTVDLQTNMTSPLTDTTLFMWNNSGASDSASQALIPTTVQNTELSQLEINDFLGAAVDISNNLTMWQLNNSNVISVTTPITNVLQVALGDSSNQHVLVLSKSGVITDYKSGNVKETVTIPARAVAIAAGTTHNLAILQTGQLYGWGSNTNGETTIPVSATIGINQIAAGNKFSLALKTDGRVIGWGKNNVNQVTIPSEARTGISQIAAGDNHGMALRNDGVVIAWGDNSYYQTTVPISLTNAIFITANANSSAAIAADGTVFVWGAMTNTSTCCANASSISLSTANFVTNQLNASQTQTTTLPANTDVVPFNNVFTNLVANKQYRYRIKISNNVGTSSYTGYFTTNLNSNKIFAPIVSR
ncbi:MAG: hypothetical protein NT020_04360, partial [Chloroflexales bacterium]|nr:hypothetical protein [Chloroflexales bacterium]